MKLTKKLELAALFIMAIFGAACMVIAFPHLEWQLTLEPTDPWESTFSMGLLITIGSSFSIILLHKEEETPHA